MKITYDETIKNYRLEVVANLLKDCEKVVTTAGWQSSKFIQLFRWADPRDELECEIAPDPKDRQVIYLKIHSPNFSWRASGKIIKTFFETFLNMEGFGFALKTADVYAGNKSIERDGELYFSYADEFWNARDAVVVLVFDD